MVDWDYLKKVLGVRDEILQRLRELEIMSYNVRFIGCCLKESEYFRRIEDFVILYRKLMFLKESGGSLNGLLYDTWFKEKFDIDINYDGMVIECLCRNVDPMYFIFSEDCIEINVRFGSNDKELVIDVLIDKVRKRLEELLYEKLHVKYFYVVVGLSECIRQIYNKVEKLSNEYNKLLKQVEQLLKKG